MSKGRRIGIIIGVCIVIILSGVGIGFFLNRYFTVEETYAFTEYAYEVCAGKSAQLTMKEPFERKFMWFSSDEDVATVSEEGVVSGLKNGTTRITARTVLYRFDAEVEIVDHTYADPTCEEDGYCIRCDEPGAPALGHTYSEASCTEDSYCDVCGKLMETAKGHSFLPPTCVLPSLCSVCGEIGTEPALGHDFLPATCIQAAFCSRCGTTDGQPLGHLVTSPITDCTKDMYCERCGEVAIAGRASHDATAATCTSASICTICGKTVANAKGHTLTGATCTQAPKCTVCGKTVGSPRGHDYTTATCTTRATCKYCGITKGSLASHYYVKNTDGRTYICAYCGRTSRYGY